MGLFPERSSSKGSTRTCRVLSGQHHTEHRPIYPLTSSVKVPACKLEDETAKERRRGRAHWVRLAILVLMRAFFVELEKGVWSLKPPNTSRADSSNEERLVSAHLFANSILITVSDGEWQISEDDKNASIQNVVEARATAAVRPVEAAAATIARFAAVPLLLYAVAPSH